MNKKLLIAGSLLGLISIILGAFAAHGLEKVVTPDAIETFQVGVRYQMYHAIVLLFVNIFEGFSAKQKNVISIMFFMGVLFFSGSIYLIQLTSITAKSIWFVTPLGGFFFIIGWVSMMVIFIKKYFNK